MKGISVTIDKHKIDYKNKSVRGRKLTVSSIVPIPMETAWNNVKRPALLEFIAKGMISFVPVRRPLPETWIEGQTYAVKMRLFGFIPFGGIHYLKIMEINESKYSISTHEWDNQVKVWNHDIMMKDLGNGNILYTDIITIYAGILTKLVTAFTKIFYQHRQKRWQIVAKDQLSFTS